LAINYLQIVKNMSKLGYTWYAKDFASDPDVMLMTAAERGIYRDLIDLAYQTNNTIKYSIEALSRYTNGEIDDIKNVLKLKGEYKNGSWRIPSCDKRLLIIKRNYENGSKPKRSQTISQIEAKNQKTRSQKPKQIEIETNTKVFVKKGHPLFAYPVGDATRMRYESDPDFRKKFDHDCKFPL
jgi:uncharacterized protein YdaU (DUF1376 family)